MGGAGKQGEGRFWKKCGGFRICFEGKFGFGGTSPNLVWIYIYILIIYFSNLLAYPISVLNFNNLLRCMTLYIITYVFLHVSSIRRNVLSTVCLGNEWAV